MQRVNEFHLYELATIIHPLTQVSNEAKYSQVWWDWWKAIEALENLFKQRSLEACWNSANELYMALKVFIPEKFEEAAGKAPAVDLAGEEELGWRVHRIRTAAEKFETVISAELSNSDTYWISPKGTHKTSMLLQYAHVAVPEPILKEIPEITFDIGEAGRCLLFDVATATGFHLLRATEVVIRRYYKLVTNTDPPKKFRNWGTYVRVLNKTKDVNPKIVAMLLQIKDHYRNPILHPEENLSPDDALVLFGLCVSAITLMGNEIKKLQTTSNNLPFPSGAMATGTTGTE